MNELFDRFVDITLEFKHRKCEELVPVPELNSVQSLCKLLDVLARPKTSAEVGNDEEAFSTICKIWFLFWYYFPTQPHPKYQLYRASD